ncbi:MAG: DNA polymerase III subunit delta [Rhizobiaceae bacterium]
MAQLKAHEVEQYLKRPEAKYRVFLIYGPDPGLVSERARVLATFSQADLNDPFSTIVLDADDAAADPQRIADEAYTVSMFGGNRLIWIKGTTQKNLANALQPILDNPPQDSLVIVEAGDLKKSAALRTRLEKAPAAITLPCYQDQVRALQQLVDQEIQQSGLSIDPQARQMLISLIGENRMASRGEVQKLCVYVGEDGTITTNDVQDIVGDASILAIDAVIDAASIGDIATMEHTLKRLLERGTSTFQLIGAAQRHFQMLHLMKCQVESGGAGAGVVINSARPPINFKRKDTVTRALSMWQLPSLEKVLKRLESVSLETRKNNALATSLTSTALLAIAIEAGQRRRRG